MGKIIEYFPIFVILLCVGLTFYETEQSTIMKICGLVIYFVGALLERAAGNRSGEEKR